LKARRLSLNDMAVIELNESLRAAILDRHQQPASMLRASKRIALGHPLGCTGAKLTPLSSGRL